MQHSDETDPNVMYNKDNNSSDYSDDDEPIFETEVLNTGLQKMKLPSANANVTLPVSFQQFDHDYVEEVINSALKLVTHEPSQWCQKNVQVWY